jgi:hypothetical protein
MDQKEPKAEFNCIDQGYLGNGDLMISEFRKNGACGPKDTPRHLKAGWSHAV